MIPIIAREYDDRQLLYRVLQNCEIWKELLPDVTVVPLTQASYALLDAVMELQDYQRTIIKIMSDGRIEAPELKEWDTVTSAIKKLICAGLQVLEASEGEGK